MVSKAIDVIAIGYLRRREEPGSKTAARAM